MRVTVWGENVHEARDPQVREIYPDGMHATIASGVRELLTQAVLDATDVLTWWGHIAHDDVDDAVVERVHQAVLGGMGLLVLHSGHYSKIFKRLLGTSCDLQWRNEGERELVWTVAPGHPIARGVPHPIVIDAQEMYG